jgi:hypothetical protein
MENLRGVERLRSIVARLPEVARGISSKPMKRFDRFSSRSATS